MNVLTDHIREIARERQNLFNEFWSRPEGGPFCERHTQIVDRVIRVVYDAVREDHPEIESVSVVATGGYGRRELSPHSDVDVSLIPPDEESTHLDAGVRKLFQRLHWAFGTELRMEVGYAYRLLSDLPGVDAATRTGLLDARSVAGPVERLQRLNREMMKHLVSGEFVLAKIVERNASFQRYHDTPLVTEPQLKEGAGGMRCFQCANWIRLAIGEQPRQPTEDYDTVIQVRNGLHLLAGRQHDLLGRSRRSEYAERLGLDESLVMQSLTQAMVVVHHEYTSAVQRLSEARFPLSEDVMAITGEARMLGNAEAGSAAVGIAIATRLGLQVSEIQPECAPVTNGPAALYAVSSGEATLRNLDLAGILETLLPELTACRSFHSQDNAHTFTVFEHTLRVLRNLEQLPAGTFLGGLKDQLVDLEPLYLAILLHDAGKRRPELEHSIAGEEIARLVGERWNLNTSVVDLVAWLVREHLTMARYIRIRDTQNPETIAEFARIVGTPERLTMLTLLTWADVNAVSDSAWTASQAAFLEGLFRATSRVLESDGEPALDPGLYRQRLLRQLAKDPANEDDLQDFLESLPAYYLTSTAPEVARLHLGLAQKALRGEPSIEVAHRTELSATELTACGIDRPGLLSRLLGVFYANDISLLAIRACTTHSDRPVAIDSFTLSFGGRIVPAATLRLVGEQVVAVLRDELDVDALLRERGKDPARRQEVYHHHFIEGDLGILEIRAPRGRGMAYRLSRWIAEQGWNIVSARIGQWAGNAAAAFYVTGPAQSRLEEAEVSTRLQLRV